MANIWKRCAGWVTALRSNLFTWARIKLTVVYLLIILFILAAYSSVLYVSLKRNIRRHTDVSIEQESHFVENTTDRIQVLISTIDIVMFIFAAAGSYWLAGITLRPIKRSLETQEAFSADASHELRTPLAVMKTDIEVLLRGKESLPPAAISVLQSNLEEINFMSTMTDQLLKLSRTSNDVSSEDSLEILDLTSLAKEVIDKFKTLAEQNSVFLEFNAVGAPSIKADRSQIIRVVQNILANAITYTEEKGLINVLVTEKGSIVELKISDTGIGIDKKHLPHIFKRFYKVDSSRTNTTSSSGLGLALTKQLLDLNHGTIDLQSEIGKGTTVLVKFPSSKLHLN